MTVPNFLPKGVHFEACFSIPECQNVSFYVKEASRDTQSRKGQLWGWPRTLGEPLCSAPKCWDVATVGV